MQQSHSGSVDLDKLTNLQYIDDELSGIKSELELLESSLCGDLQFDQHIFNGGGSNNKNAGGDGILGEDAENTIHTPNAPTPTPYSVQQSAKQTKKNNNQLNYDNQNDYNVNKVVVKKPYLKRTSLSVLPGSKPDFTQYKQTVKKTRYSSSFAPPSSSSSTHYQNKNHARDSHLSKVVDEQNSQNNMNAQDELDLTLKMLDEAHRDNVKLRQEMKDLQQQMKLRLQKQQVVALKPPQQPESLTEQKQSTVDQDSVVINAEVNKLKQQLQLQQEQHEQEKRQLQQQVQNLMNSQRQSRSPQKSVRPTESTFESLINIYSADGQQSPKRNRSLSPVKSLKQAEQLKQLRDEIQSLKDDNLILEQQLSDAIRHGVSNNQGGSNGNMQMKDYQLQLGNRLSEIGQLRRDYDKLSKEKNKISLEKSSLQRKLQQIELDYQSLEVQNKGLLKSEQQCQKRIVDLTKKLDEVKFSGPQSHDLQQELVILRRSHADAQSQIAKLKSENLELSSLKYMVKSLTSDLQLKQVENQQLVMEIDQFKVLAHDLKQKLNSQEKQIQQKNDDLHQLNGLIDQMKAEQIGLSQKLQLYSDIESGSPKKSSAIKLVNKIEKMERELKVREQQIKSLLSTYDIDQFRQLIADKDAQIRHYGQELEKLIKQMQNMR
ncbi:hypothetical protein MP228_006041 [Amoeboaphelidium protococcarum]|nr:hypothetical protein MP228_006041 [Amoeboaphelidium protococcarum]